MGRIRIVKPFSTTKPLGVGTGLERFIAYCIITETHKGSINVESAPGKGITFIIQLSMESNGIG